MCYVYEVKVNKSSIDKPEPVMTKEFIEERMKVAEKYKKNSPAFVLSSKNSKDFFDNEKTSKDVLKRFYSHSPKDGVHTPFK